jgi:hypothetical protein
MPQPTPAQQRVIDPILSAHARGFRQPQLVAATLFPIAYVAAYGGQAIEFGKEAFRLYNSARAPGTHTKRIQFGYAGKPFAIQPRSLEGVLPRELQRDANVPGVDAAARAVNVPLRSLLLEHEHLCASLARNASLYDNEHKVALSGSERWTGETSDPTADIETAKEAIRASIGIEPNTVMISGKAFAALRSNTKIIERMKYTGRDSLTTEVLKALWDIENVVVGKAVVADAADDFGDVWGTDVVVAYTNVSTSVNQEEPSYGYTYAIEGMPAVEEPYYDNNAKSWIYPVSYDMTPVLTGITAGYLIQNAGAPAS